VSDEVYAAVRGQLSETEMSNLGFLIVAINGWNRLSIAFLTTPGSADAILGLDKAGMY
jgi:alkylhydroperoxidase family enzyme